MGGLFKSVLVRIPPNPNQSCPFITTQLLYSIAKVGATSYIKKTRKESRTAIPISMLVINDSITSNFPYGYQFRFRQTQRTTRCKDSQKIPFTESCIITRVAETLLYMCFR